MKENLKEVEKEIQAAFGMDLELVHPLAETGNGLSIGNKVKCISDYENNWGGCEPIRGNLKIGKVYKVQKIEVHSWHTKIWLKGFNKPFNSVHFQ